MIFKVIFKDPDSLHDAVKDAVAEEVEELEELDKDEKESLVYARSETTLDLCSKWFEFSEYLTVEIDTIAKTCVVVPVKS